MRSQQHRPKHWKDLIGQPVISEIREAIREASRGPFMLICWLFKSFGITGCGKSSAAYLAAKKLNGGEEPEFFVSQTCTARDLLSPDYKYRSLFGNGRRVNILNDIEHFSSPCKKALLDVLDHAPRHMVFIATTTRSDWANGDTGLETRFRHFEFQAVTEADIIKKLTYVSEKEGLLLPDGFDYAKYLAGHYGRKPVRGNVRDAINHLESAIAAFKRMCNRHRGT